MRIAPFIIAGFMVFPHLAAAQQSPNVLAQVQAAEVLSDLLTYTVARADARVNAMQAYLKEIGKDSAYAQARPVVGRRSSMDFAHVFQGAVDFVKAGGAKYADAALASLNEDQLLSELTALQTYNIGQFMHLNDQRAAADSIAAYLDSIGQFDDYLKWAQSKLPHGAVPAPATQPSASTPEELAAQMETSIQTARAVAWSKALARGVSQADFDRQWQLSLERYREFVAGKVDGVRALAGSLGQTQLAGAPPPAPPPAPQIAVQPNVVWQTGPQSAPMGPTLPPTVQSQYTASYYQNQNAFLWNNWGDPYGDVCYSSGHH